MDCVCCIVVVFVLLLPPAHRFIITMSCKSSSPPWYCSSLSQYVVLLFVCIGLGATVLFFVQRFCARMSFGILQSLSFRKRQRIAGVQHMRDSSSSETDSDTLGGSD